MDSDKIQKFIEGDKEVFSLIYMETKNLVYSIIFRTVLNTEEAADLMHDVFVKIWQNKHTFKPDKDITAWIARIATNHTLNFVKRRSWLKRKSAEIYHHYKEPNTESKFESTINIMTLLSKLPAHYKMPIILKDIEELPYEKIAEILGVPVGTVRSRLNRARAKLLDLYTKEVKINGK